MTIIQGQIESLKRIKETLNQKGVVRFNSIGDINDFIKNYELEKQAILNKVEHDLDLEIVDLQVERIKLEKDYDNLKAERTNKLKNRIIRLKSKYDIILSSNTNSAIKKIIDSLYLKILKLTLTNLERNFDKIIRKHTRSAKNKVNAAINKINEYTIDREKIITQRSSQKCEELEYTKEIVDSLNTLIAGAIGENLVVKELEKLSDDYILFNDFSIDFKTPIYNRKEKDRIYSIQIDHLLVANSGIFLIETKNWSKSSIDSLDLRSPVKQIMRTSYALFVILNGRQRLEGLTLNRHHWGDKKLPIRNIVVMINQKPKEKFKFVQVKTLKELNRYITYFDPIFDDSEVINISEYLKMIQN